MGDSISFYNCGFSILMPKIRDLWNTKIVKVYATTIPSNLVKECPMNEQPIEICPYYEFNSKLSKTRKMY